MDVAADNVLTVKLEALQPAEDYGVVTRAGDFFKPNVLACLN